MAVYGYEKGREFVFGGWGFREDVADFPVFEHHRVGDERAVAAPGDGFGAHDGGRSCACYFGEGGEAFGKLRGGHVVGIAAEGCVAPAGVDGVFAGVAAAAEGFQMRVIDVGGAERGCQCVGIELRNVARFGNGADVDEMMHMVRVQQFDELFDRVG